MTSLKATVLSKEKPQTKLQWILTSALWGSRPFSTHPLTLYVTLRPNPNPPLDALVVFQVAPQILNPKHLHYGMPLRDSKEEQGTNSKCTRIEQSSRKSLLFCYVAQDDLGYLVLLPPHHLH